MKLPIFIFFFLSLSFYLNNINAQCEHITLVDSSFENGTLIGGGDFVEGIWYRDDGCTIQAGGYSGDSSACSNGGGAFQLIPVDSNTTYFLNCYVRNGMNDELLHLRINWMSYHQNPSSNDWTPISQSFNSGSDTVAIVGFYSGGAYFDDVSVTCSPLVGIEELETEPVPFFIYPMVSSDEFSLKMNQVLTVEILDLSGRIVKKYNSIDGQIEIGKTLSPAMYIVRLSTGKKSWSKKIIKL